MNVTARESARTAPGMSPPRVVIVTHARSAPGKSPPVAFSQTVERGVSDKVRHSDGDTLHFAPGSGRHEIVFKLDDQSGLGLRFPPAAHEAIWIEEGDRCPTSAGQHDDFVDADVTADTLSIHNLNERQARLHYALNFQDPAGRRVQYDPIIHNGGGGTSSS